MRPNVFLKHPQVLNKLDYNCVESAYYVPPSIILLNGQSCILDHVMEQGSTKIATESIDSSLLMIFSIPDSKDICMDIN